jgi:hypothetical protein
LREILVQKRMDNVDFQIEEVERLTIDPVSGKTRMILKPETAGRKTSVREGDAADSRRRSEVSAWPRTRRHRRSRADARGTTSKRSRSRRPTA